MVGTKPGNPCSLNLLNLCGGAADLNADAQNGLFVTVDTKPEDLGALNPADIFVKFVIRECQLSSQMRVQQSLKQERWAEMSRTDYRIAVIITF